MKKYIAIFEQHLRNVRAHNLTQYAATTGPALAQRLYAGLPKILRTVMARRRPDLINPELRDDYEGLKREIMQVLKWPDAISEFEKFEHASNDQRKIHAGFTAVPPRGDRKRHNPLGDKDDYISLGYSDLPDSKDFDESVVSKWLIDLKSSKGCNKMQWKSWFSKHSKFTCYLVSHP